jgi:hypothetical protein
MGQYLAPSFSADLFRQFAFGWSAAQYENYLPMISDMFQTRGSEILEQVGTTPIVLPVSSSPSSPGRVILIICLSLLGALLFSLLVWLGVRFWIQRPAAHSYEVLAASS